MTSEDYTGSTMGGGLEGGTVGGIQTSWEAILLDSMSRDPSCMALHGMVHSFIELHKAVIHVIILASFQ